MFLNKILNTFLYIINITVYPSKAKEINLSGIKQTLSLK